jgi:hypothetical protein
MNQTPIVIDTNIVFKALRLPYSHFREMLSQTNYHFYAPKFLLVEIFKHKDKILKNNSQSDDDFYEYFNGSYREAFSLFLSYLFSTIVSRDLQELRCPITTYSQQYSYRMRRVYPLHTNR